MSSVAYVLGELLNEVIPKF